MQTNVGRPVVIAALTAALMLPASSARAQPYAMGPEFSTVTTDIETPHVRWARPLAGGPLRLLAIGPRFAHRETAELMQRLEVECSVVMTHSHTALGADSGIAGFRESEVLEALEAHLARPHDVIILGVNDLQSLPKPLQYEVLRQVSEGVGLLLVRYADGIPDLLPRLFERVPVPDLLSEGVVWEAIPSLGGLGEDGGPRILRFAGRLKEGRCLVLRWPAGVGGFHYLTAEPGTQLEYDHNMSVVARALLWLAGREPAARLALSTDAVTEEGIRIACEGLEAGQGVLVEVCDHLGEGVHSEWLPTPPAEGVRAPGRLKAGRHFVNAWVREGRDGPTVTWASAWFDVPSLVGGVTLTTPRPRHAPGDMVQAEAAVGEAAGEDLVARLTATDIHGRRWAQVEGALPAGATAATLEFAAEGMASTYSLLRLDLLLGGEVVESVTEDLFVPLRERRDFSLGVWGGGGSSWLSRTRWELNRHLGVDTTIFSGDIKAGIRATPYSTTNFRHGGKGAVRDPCLTDPGFWEQETERLQKVAEGLAHADVFAYNLGDEICLDVGNTDVCRSATCLAGFRQWLQERYASLEALNESWGTEFAGWDEVRPRSRREADAAGRLPSWLCHRLFMDEVFLGGLARARDIFHETDPGVPVGAEGLWGSTSAYGMDWWPMSRELAYLVPYWRARLAVESIRCFQRPGTVTGTWFGNYGEQSIDEALLRWFPWNVLAHQYNSIWWYPEYRAVQFGAVATALAPDYRPTAGFAATLEEIAEIRTGFDALLLGGRRAHDGIAVLYSRPTIHVWGNKARDLLDALEEVGLQYDILPAEELSAAALNAGGYRLLILPAVCVLSERQTEEMRRFVREGGALLAMLPPGLYDSLGEARADSPLSDVLGVSGLTAAISEELRQVTPVEGEPFEVTEVGVIGSLNGARAIGSFADGAPAATMNRFGEGHVCLLAYSLSGFTRARGRGGEVNGGAGFVGGVLAELGVRPAVQALSDDPLTGLEIARFAYPGAECVVLTLEPLGSLAARDVSVRRITLQFPDERLTRDLRGAVEFGRTDRVEVAMRPGDTVLMGRMDEPRPAPEVRVEAQVRPGGTVTVRIEQAVAEGVLHMSVLTPEGTRAPWWERNVTLEGGPVEAPLHVALNAAEGDYTVRVRDPLSGGTAEAVFRVAG